MKRVKTFIICVASMLVLSSFLAACSGNNSSSSNKSAAKDKIVMKLGHVNPTEHHYQLAATEFARLINEKTDGQIEVQIYPSSQLGGELQMIQALKTGTQELLISSQAPITNTVQEWGIFDLPYLFDNSEQANEILKGPVGKKFLDMLEQEGMIGLSWFASLERNVFTTKVPVRTVDDLKALKLRVIQSSGYVESYKGVGANPTPLAYSELYMALQQGVIDGADTSPDQFLNDKFNEISKYFSLTRMHYMPIVFAVSKVFWDKLSPELQQALQEAADEAAAYDIQIFSEMHNESLEEMNNLGIEVIDIDTTPWIEATESVRSQILTTIPDGQSLYQEIVEAKQ